MEGPTQLANDNGTLYFSTDDGKHGHELWRSNGTRKGTRMVKDINPGRAGSLPLRVSPSSDIPFYFLADDGVHGAELWRSDGTAVGTSIVKDLYPSPDTFQRGLPGSPTSAAPSTSVCPWILRSSDQGCTEATAPTRGRPSSRRSSTSRPHRLSMERSTSAAPATTQLQDRVVAKRRHDGGDDCGQGGPGVPGEIIDVNGTLFIASDGTRGLWRSDGTEPGTVMVKNITPAGAIHNLTNINGAVYFLVSSRRCTPRQLWRSDGTEAGTTSKSPTSTGIQFDLTAFKGRLYFPAGGALWRSDGTPRGTTVVKGNCSSKAGARLRCFFGLTATGTNGTLYLVGSDKRYGGELWQSNGTRKGTRIVSDIRRGRDSSLPMYLTAVNRTLYFTANDGRHGRELWKVGPRPCKTVKGKCKKG